MNKIQLVRKETKKARSIERNNARKVKQNGTLMLGAIILEQIDFPEEVYEHPYEIEGYKAAHIIINDTMYAL